MAKTKSKSKQTETTTRDDELTTFASTPQVIDDDEILDDDENLDDDDEPTGNYLEPTSGTLSITGALSVDLTVNGNVKVSGEISSNVKATGSITYGSLTGTIEENAELETCDIQVDGGTLTFAAAVSEDEAGGMYTTGQVTNASGVSTTVFGRVVIDGTVNNQLYNNGGTFVVGNGGVLDVTSSIGSGNRVIYNTAGTFTVEAGGEVVSMASKAAHGIYSEATGTINCYGKITTTSSASYDGLVLLGPCNIKDGGELIATGARYGVYNYSNSAANFTIESGGKATLTGGTYGLYAAVGSTNISGKLSVEATASGSYGIYNTATFNTQAGSEVETIGVTYGIRNTSTANLSGKLTAEGTGTSGVGVYVSAGTMNIYESAEINAVGYLYGLQSTTTFNNYGTLTATVSSTASSTYAVYQNSTFTIYDGGSITAKGGDRGWYNSGGTMTLNASGAIVTEGSLYGLYATGTLNLYGTIQATGGTADFYCTGTSNFGNFASSDYVPIEETAEPVRVRSYAAIEEEDEDEDTFYLPDMRGRFPENAGSSYSLGTPINAGAPELFGYFDVCEYRSRTSLVANSTGIMTIDSGAGNTASRSAGTSSSKASSRVTITASNSSSLYSLSTVQPEARAIYYIIKT